jgi:hypothetical protein
MEPFVDRNGSKFWSNKEGQYHREDGPAIIAEDGDKWWYNKGLPHREDGPAIECSNGAKWWYVYGKRHRVDGPAVELSNGNKRWWLYDIEYTEEEYLILTRNQRIESLLELI